MSELPSDPSTNQPAAVESAAAKSAANLDRLVIDLPDPTTAQRRARPALQHPADPAGLSRLMETTPARIGVGRAGPRPRTGPWLLFQADQAVTQDTLYRDVDPDLLEEMHLFTVHTAITGGKAQYLLRPDLGRALDADARQMIHERCQPDPQIQVCVGDGLSAQAIEANLPKIWAALVQRCRAAGLSLGTPFFIHSARVGVMNEIGDLLHPQVLMLLIGERPGLGRAESMSIYMAYQPRTGHSDANRDVICNVFEGGLPPAAAAHQAVDLARQMIHYQTSGVSLKRIEDPHADTQ